MVGTIFRIIGGIIVIAIGSMVIIKTEKILEVAGRNAWAETKFGSWGGTRAMWKMIGLIVVFVGLLITTNMFGGFVQGTVVKWLVPQAEVPAI